jgi:Fe-S-cluster-containing dehydrogenase component
MQYGMIIDIDRCVGCHACVIACKAEWEVPAQFNRNWVHRLGPSMTSAGMAYTYYPGLCNHCSEPPCVPVCPADPVKMTMQDAKTGETVTMEVTATWKDPFNGTVQIDTERCIGCGACRDACPYNARYINEALGRRSQPSARPTSAPTACRGLPKDWNPPVCRPAWPGPASSAISTTRNPRYRSMSKRCGRPDFRSGTDRPARLVFRQQKSGHGIADAIRAPGNALCLAAPQPADQDVAHRQKPDQRNRSPRPGRRPVGQINARRQEVIPALNSTATHPLPLLCAAGDFFMCPVVSTFQNEIFCSAFRGVNLGAGVSGRAPVNRKGHIQNKSH